MRVKTRALKTLCAAVPVVGLLTLSACAGEDPAAAPDDAPSAAAAAESDEPAADDGVRVIRPGAPGEEPEEGPTDLPEPEHNEADVAFMTMMVPHHRQALVMSDLAETRAEDPAVRRLAARIRAAQAPEIQFMSDWLESKGEEAPAPEDDRVDGMDMGGMDMGMEMGMLDADELVALVDAEGEEFDQLFLDGMIGHHQGAVDMTIDVSGEGVDQQVSELAADMNLGQNAEIGRMQDILDKL